tara:strand:- start:238 stop:777 length:540 start_codon:yes stop_codon:yes gene_type:complete
MNYKVRIQKNKDFQILENNTPIVKGTKPKWYSSEISFFYNNRTFQIKKKSFWKGEHEITASGKKVGNILIRSVKKPLGNFIQVYENNSFKDEYSMTSTSKSIWSSEKTYSLFNKDNEILKINYSWKKHSWIKYTEEISVDSFNTQGASPELIVYSLFLMRLIQQQEAAANSGGGAMIYG